MRKAKITHGARTAEMEQVRKNDSEPQGRCQAPGGEGLIAPRTGLARLMVMTRRLGQSHPSSDQFRGLFRAKMATPRCNFRLFVA